MPRVFVLSDDISANIVSIDGSDARHLGLVLRLTPGDTFVAVDECGREHTASVELVRRDLITGRIVETRTPDVEPKTHIVLAQAVPKARKMDLIVRKCTELGVGAIIPMTTERVVPQADEAKARQRRGRWQRIAAEASKQSHRTVIPEVRPIAPFDEALPELAAMDLCLLFSELEERRPLREVLGSGIQVSSLGLLIGPEGGFSVAELEAATGAGAVPVTLGPRILRTETAALAALSIALYELGEMGER
ncbi:MAG: RsmE family RNA methyltransferase [Armatimonadota bacterium]|jgi:16S rRNA (uracil1498-N3)-methyltransferase